MATLYYYYIYTIIALYLHCIYCVVNNEKYKTISNMQIQQVWDNTVVMMVGDVTGAAL